MTERQPILRLRLHRAQPDAATPCAMRVTASMVASALLCGSIGMPTLAWAQAANARNPAGVSASQAPVTLNFVNAEIEGVARAVGAILNRQFIVDPRVKGAMTLYSDQPITPREVYLNFLTALRGLGFTVVDNMGVLKIVPEADAKLQAGTVSVGPVTRQGDVVMTQIFKLNHENVNNLVPVLRPLISPNNTINANPGNNTLVITDYADNLNRLGKIIASMDLPATTDVEVIPLKYAIAGDTAALVQKLVEPGAAAGGAPGATTGASPSILVDARSNALVIRAANPARLAMIRSVVAKLDQPAIGGNAAGGIYVVYLKNADAVRLAAVLRAAYQPNTSGGSGGGASPLTAGGGLSTGGGSPTSLSNSSSGMNSSSGGIGGSSASTTPVSATAGPSTGGMVQADPATNSLIITAPEPLYRAMRVVIDQLDSRRAQVYIESMIVKMDANKAAEFGFQWQAISGRSGDGTIYGAGTNFGDAANIVTLSAAAAQGRAGVVAAAAAPPNGFNIGLLKNMGGFYTLGALARFLESNTDSNVLSTPNLVALDNEEAKIVIGQNVPFLTGQYSNATSSNGTVNPFQTFERKDVGLTLRVRPQIGEGGTVRMTVYQENSNVLPASATSSSGLVTDKSSIETTVTVDDGQIMVLGGLLKDEYSNGTDKIPGLGDVPVVGNLFRSDSRKRNKSNLMVFLRPVIMKSAPDVNAVSLDRYDSMRSQQQQSQPKESVLVPINASPVLPESNSPGGLLPLPYPGYAAPSPSPHQPPVMLTPGPVGLPPSGPSLVPTTPRTPN